MSWFTVLGDRLSSVWCLDVNSTFKCSYSVYNAPVNVNPQPNPMAHPGDLDRKGSESPPWHKLSLSKFPSISPIYNVRKYWYCQSVSCMVGGRERPLSKSCGLPGGPKDPSSQVHYRLRFRSYLASLPVNPDITHIHLITTSLPEFIEAFWITTKIARYKWSTV